MDNKQAEMVQKEINRNIGILDLHPEVGYNVIVSLVDIYVNTPEYQKDIKCGSVTNCSFCCHDKIPIGVVEGQIIKKYVEDNNILVHMDRVIKQNSGEKITFMEKACPLLMDENEEGNRLCSIYDNRPLICRTHNSTSDPVICKRDTDENTVELMCIETIALSFLSYKLDSNEPIDALPTMTSINEIFKT